MNYYIQGNATKAEQIKAAFKEKGYRDQGWMFSSKHDLYFSVGALVYAIPYKIRHIITERPDYKELELPKPHYDISNFHAGMPVLVRDSVKSEWKYVAFSHREENRFCACGLYWYQCIPYNDDTKHLLGTTDMPSEEYINW